MIHFYAELLGTLGVSDWELRLNSIGDRQCRPRYVERLNAWLDAHDDLLDDEARHKRQTSPLQVFDVKNAALTCKTWHAAAIASSPLWSRPPAHTGGASGIGAALVERAIDGAKAAGITDLYLLTTTAVEWAPRFGFAPVARNRVAEAVRGSPQFTGGTCSSAVAMHRVLVD